jgi:membrane protein DedA with SNARE-associated domain
MLVPTVTAVLISGHEIDHLADTYGYGLVFLLVALQCSGVPVPGTSALAAAAIYTGATHRLEIAAVIGAAAAGSIIGYFIGFQLGRWGGERLIARYGGYLRLTPERLVLSRYVFDPTAARSCSSAGS